MYVHQLETKIVTSRSMVSCFLLKPSSPSPAPPLLNKQQKHHPQHFAFQVQKIRSTHPHQKNTSSFCVQSAICTIFQNFMLRECRYGRYRCAQYMVAAARGRTKLKYNTHYLLVTTLATNNSAINNKTELLVCTK